MILFYVRITFVVRYMILFCICRSRPHLLHNVLEISGRTCIHRSLQGTPLFDILFLIIAICAMTILMI